MATTLKRKCLSLSTVSYHSQVQSLYVMTMYVCLT